MGRTLVWIEGPSFLGWGCSECPWVFNPSWPPAGESLEAMKQHYERQRNEDFAAHVCAPSPAAKDTRKS